MGTRVRGASDTTCWSAGRPLLGLVLAAVIALAAVVCLLVLTVDLRGAIGFSSFGVLVYYAIANASAFSQPAAVRCWLPQRGGARRPGSRG